METLKEIECTTGRRDNEDPLSLTFPEETVIDEKIVNPATTIDDSHQFSTECDIGQAKCLLSEPTNTSNCNFDTDNDCLKSKKALKIFPTFNITMLLKYSKELLGFFALILTTYATLLNKESVIGGTTSPKPIFLLDSIVQEWPHGNLENVQSKVAVSELSLIYFYAPWCAESLHAKKVYSSVANLYSEEVYFAAVNCWQPNSGCRTLYSNVYKWPVLMAYLPNALSVQYNGDWNAHSLSKFIDGLLMPVMRVHNPRELLNLRIANDGVIFGIFHSCDTREFQIFFQTALKWLENNYYEYTKFAVFVGEDTSMFLSPQESQQAPVIKLFTTNDTIIYSKTKWTSKTILHFVKYKLAESSIWVNLPSAKSSIMHKNLQREPVLMMISPRVSLSNHYFIMKQLIYTFNSYYPNDLNITVLNEYAINMKQKHPMMLKKLKNFCEFSKRLQRQGIRTPFIGGELWSESLFSGPAAPTNMSKKTSSLFHRYIDVEYCEKDLHENGCSRSIDSVDYRSPTELLKKYMQKQCVMMENVHRKLADKGTVEPIDNVNISKFNYKRNETLKYIMLDSIVHHEYIRHLIGDLGYQELSGNLSPQMFIIDNDKETLHMQRNAISTKTSLEFVNDFYQGKLSRHLKSSKKVEIKNSISDNLLIKIKEINSRQFAKIINRSNITSVVLIYTPQCALCNIMSQALLQVSHIIKLRTVKFYRINASANDVCWEYTMDKYPTLIIFPQNRSSDTNVYLASLPISVKNIFSFILLNLNQEQRLNALINACLFTKLSLAFQNCVSQVRGMIDNEISHQLQKWEEPSTNRTHLLTRLKELKTIYLELLRARKTEDLTIVSKEIIKYGNGRNY